jgi:hypothetical protein
MASDEDFLAPILAAMARYRDGPCCALCSAVSLPESDLPDLSAPLSTTVAMDATHSIERCPRVGLTVAPWFGADCHQFSRREPA